MSCVCAAFGWHSVHLQQMAVLPALCAGLCTDARTDLGIMVFELMCSCLWAPVFSLASQPSCEWYGRKAVWIHSGKKKKKKQQLSVVPGCTNSRGSSSNRWHCHDTLRLFAVHIHSSHPEACYQHISIPTTRPGIHWIFYFEVKVIFSSLFSLSLSKFV